MTLSLVLIVFVSASETQAPATVALRHAAQEVLGSGSEIRVMGYSALPDDAELSDAGRGADAVAEVTWLEERQQRALVHCYLGASHRFVNRELVFDDRDEVQERGRMLGFAIASMLPEVQPSDPSQHLPVPPARRATPGREPVEPSTAAGVSLRAVGARRALGAIDTAALLAIAAGSADSSLGVGIAGRWLFHRSLSLRLAGGIRYGKIEVARAQSELFFGGLGLAFQLTRPDPSSRFVFGGRVDALITANTLRRSRADAEVPESQTRVQPATDLLLEGSWYFLESTALLLASGGEFGLGHTDIVVQGREIADVAAFRWVAELGVSARF
jgi:hypothetical protein